MSDTAAFSDLSRDECDIAIATIIACNTARQLHDENGELSGRLDCPKCRQPVAYVVAKCNGHTAGRCTTKECVTWRE